MHNATNMISDELLDNAFQNEYIRLLLQTITFSHKNESSRNVLIIANSFQTT